MENFLADTASKALSNALTQILVLGITAIGGGAATLAHRKKTKRWLWQRPDKIEKHAENIILKIARSGEVKEKLKGFGPAILKVGEIRRVEVSVNSEGEAFIHIRKAKKEQDNAIRIQGERRTDLQ